MKTELTSPNKVLPIAIKPASPRDLFEEMFTWTDRIAKRAHKLFRDRGFTDGHDLDDWFAAERELLKPIALKVKDNKDEFLVRAEVTGFEAKDLKIEMDGRNLAIKGNREASREEKENEGKTVYTERKAEQIYRMVELPATVLTENATAEVKNGILEIKLAKASKPKNIMVTAA